MTVLVDSAEDMNTEWDEAGREKAWGCVSRDVYLKVKWIWIHMSATGQRLADAQIPAKICWTMTMEEVKREGAGTKESCQIPELKDSPRKKGPLLPN